MTRSADDKTVLHLKFVSLQSYFLNNLELIVSVGIDVLAKVHGEGSSSL